MIIYFETYFKHQIFTHQYSRAVRFTSYVYMLCIQAMYTMYTYSLDYNINIFVGCYLDISKKQLNNNFWIIAASQLHTHCNYVILT